MACTRQTKINKQPSILFDTLFSISNDESLAEEQLAHFESDAFKEDFAKDTSTGKVIDWVEDSRKPIHRREINQNRVDENGEPLLIFDNKYGKYYYLNKDNSKIYYPKAVSELNSSYTNQAIRDITKKLALNFVKDRLSDNFNEFDFSKKEGTIRKSINGKIRERSTELVNSGDFEQFIKGNQLLESLDNIDEWVRNVEDYFREIKLVYKETTDIEDQDAEETEERGQSWGTASFEKSTKNNITANIKLSLSLLQNEGTKDDLFFENEFRDFSEVYSTLSGVLTNRTAKTGEDLFETYLNEVFKLIPKKPYLAQLHEQLKKMNDYKKAEFVSAFNLHKNLYYGTVFNITSEEVYNDNKDKIGDKFTIKHDVLNLSNVGAKDRFVKNGWYHNFIKIFSNKNNIIDAESYVNLTKGSVDFTKFNNNLKLTISEYDSFDDLDPIVTELFSYLEKIGVVTTKEGVQHYLDGLNSEKVDIDTYKANIIKLSSDTKFLLTRLADKTINLNRVNPFDDQDELKNLAKAEAFYISEMSDASIFAGGKSRWLYSYPSYLSSKIQSWRNDRSLLLAHYELDKLSSSSHYMHNLLALDIEDITERLRTSQERLDEFQLAIFNTLQEEEKTSDVVDNKTITKNDFFADTYNKLLSFKKSTSNGVINTTTPADKGTQYQFKASKGMLFTSNARYVNEKVIIDDKGLNILFDHVKGEFERIKSTQRELNFAEETGDRSNLKMYKHIQEDESRPNGLNFASFPSLNFNTFNHEKSGFSLYKADGKPIDFDLETVKDLIMPIIEDVISKDIEATNKHLRDAGITAFDENGITINRAIDNQIWESYGDINTGLKVAGDIYINGLISQLEYSKMFAGDVAYYKNMMDYKKRIPATYSDGLQLYLRAGKEFFNVAVIEGVEVSVPYMAELIELVGEEIASNYTKVNSTDAQAWITPERWRFLKQRLGKWSEIDDIVYDKLTEVNEEPFTLEELKHAAQPLKGVYFEINNGAPVYLKYSQAVLLPQIVKNNPELQKFKDKMDVKNIDELITIDGIKVGANIPVKTHDINGNVLNDFELTTIQLKNSGWKLQQDLPTKGFKDTAVGSQIQKNIFTGLAFNKEELFLVDDEELTGGELIDHINDIVGLLSNKGVANLKKEFGIGSDNKITNINKLNKVLIDELKSRGSSQNVINALESGLSPFGIPGSQQKLQNIFASIATKRIVKIKTNGGSFIQIANYGYTNDQANSKGVIWTPWAKDKTHEPEFLKNEDGSFKLSESGKKIVRPGGILISGSFIAKYVPGYEKMSHEELFGTKESNYTDGLIDRKILDNIVGYRIPNQALASNDALEIVGILPPGVGDSVVAYTGITKKTGSDFDIDKMYLMMGSFKATFKNAKKIRDYANNQLRGDTILKTAENIADLLDQLDSEIETDINADDIASMMFSKSDKDLKNQEINNLINILLKNKIENPFITELKTKIPGFNKIGRLVYSTPRSNNLGEMSKDELQNKLIEAYKSVLTNSSVIQNVMTPIDYDFIKDDILQLFPRQEEKDLFHFNITEDINLKYQFSAGKAGVGQTANTMMDHIRGSMADLSFHKYYLGIGEFRIKDGIKETIFDTKETSKDIKEKGNNQKRIKITDSLSAILNAFVDIAKDPYITRGNWNTQTANVGFMLLRAGVHPFHVNALLGQPILKEYVEFVTNSESKINNDTGNLSKKFLKEKFGEEKPSLKIDPLFDIGDFTLKELRSQIANTESDEFIQKNIFKTFIEWQNQSKKVGENNKASKFDVEGYGKNVTSLIVYKNLINKLLITGEYEAGNFKGFASKLKKDGKNTFLAHYKEGIIDFIGDVMVANPGTFLVAQPDIIDTFNEISKGVTGDVLTNDELATKLETAYYSYLMSGFKPFDVTNEDKAVLLESIIKDLSNYKKGSKNILIQELDIKLAERVDGKETFFIGMNNRKKSVTYETDLIAAWLDLIEDNPKLAEDLIKYSYITSGFQMNMNQFYNLIPYQWFVRNGLNDHIRAHVSNLEGVDTIFMKNFFKHSLKDDQIVSKVFNSMKDRNYIRDVFGFVLKDKDNVKSYVKQDVEVSKDMLGEPIYKARLYELVGYTKDNKPVYMATSSKGSVDKKGFKVYEYSPIESDNSIFSKNNVKVPIKRQDEINRYIAPKQDIVNSSPVANVEIDIVNDNDVVVEKEIEDLIEPKTLKEYADKYNIRFYQNREIVTQEDIDYYDGQLKRLLDGGSFKYAMFEFFENTTNLRNKSSFKRYYDKLIEKGFKPVEGKEYILSKGGVNPIDEFNKEYRIGKVSNIVDTSEIYQKRNIFTVKPIQAVDKKAISKASIATQYIGFAEGIEGSSTALYAKQAGDVANTGVYNFNDVIFVSVGGKRGTEVIRQKQQDKTIIEAIKALEKGATLLTDNKEYVDNNPYNEGEKKLKSKLESERYNYSEIIVDENKIGVWNKVNNKKIKPIDPNQLDIFNNEDNC